MALRFEPGFRFVPPEGALLVESGVKGVRIHAAGVVREEGALKVPLQIAWALPEPEAFTFRAVDRAVVVQAEGDGLFAAASLLDPELPEEGYEPNHLTGEMGGHPDNTVFGFAACTVSLPPGGGDVFVHATLLGRVSNVLCIGADGAVKSFLEGAPHAVQLADLPAE
jgi:hypothetical protein